MRRANSPFAATAEPKKRRSKPPFAANGIACFVCGVPMRVLSPAETAKLVRDLGPCRHAPSTEHPHVRCDACSPALFSACVRTTKAQ